STDFVPVGCYRDLQLQPRPLPELIHNYRLNDEMDWLDLNNTVIKPCAEQARRKGYLYFGVQFYGECWSGATAHASYMKDDPSRSCVAGVGRGFANMVYRRVGEERECEGYTTLDSQDRSALYTNKPEASETLLCDGPDPDGVNGNTVTAWYRFNGLAGSEMADQPIPHDKCRTKRGGWFNGRYPNVTEGIVTRKAYFGKNDLDGVEMKVRNCGSFYVYKLGPVPGCRMRYCGNEITAVEEKFSVVGCYRDSKDARLLPELIVNYRTNGGALDWINLNDSVVKPCAKVAIDKGYEYFGVEFYGECWSGPKGSEASITIDKISTDCVSGVGKALTIMVYKKITTGIP
ncbi:hypothetical protein QZH41_019613, partial [Actinostola sp. cb2023]